MRPRPLLVFQLFLRSSRVQKKRAILTVAAIAWGSLSLLLLLSFGEGLKRQLCRWPRPAWGSNIAVMWPGETTSPGRGCRRAGRSGRGSRTSSCCATAIPAPAGVTGEMRRLGARPTATARRTVNWQANRRPAWTTARCATTSPQAGGRFLNPLDEQLRRRVVFLGYELAEDLFGDEDPVGQTLLVDGVPYTVVGVMEPKMQMGNYGGPDDGPRRHPDHAPSRRSSAGTS